MALPEHMAADSDTILRLLKDEGLPDSEIVVDLVSKEVRNGPERSWFRLLNFGEFANEHIIYGALSEMTFRAGTFIAPAFISLDLLNISLLSCSRERKKRTLLLVEKLKPTFRGHTGVIYFVPVEISEHWGLCVADFCSDTGIVYFGDSKGMRSTFIRLAHVLADVMRWIYSDKVCKITGLNLMLDKLRFVEQQDNYSCGFYVIAAIASYATNLGTLEGYGFAQKCSVLVTDVMRTQAVKCYYQRVIEAYHSYQKRNSHNLSQRKSADEFSEYHVFRFIESNCLGHVFPDNENQRYCEPTPSPFRGPTAERLILEDPQDYITTLNLGGAKFQKSENTSLTTRNKDDVDSHVTYTCQRENGTCPARVYIYQMKDGRVVGKRVHLHSHVP